MSMNAPVAVVLESSVEADCPQVEVDELRANSQEISAALQALGYRTAIVTCTLDVADVRRQLEALAPGLVFNLVDSIEGKGNLISIAPMLLSHMNIPFTGATALATAVTCDKLLTKQILRANHITIADCLSEAQIEAGGSELAAPYILKSISEHASFGIFSDSVVATRALLKARLQERKREYGSQWFAERYIEGREFNLGLLATADPQKPAPMPASEIRFTPDFPKDKPRIIDYSAKWLTATPEYKGSVRHFDFDEKDAPLLQSLREIALACWGAFDLSGYARVDFRVDASGVPHVLEVNSNPLLTANEGFGVAARQSGLSFNDCVRAIVADAYRRSARPLPAMLAA